MILLQSDISQTLTCRVGIHAACRARAVLLAFTRDYCEQAEVNKKYVKPGYFLRRARERKLDGLSIGSDIDDVLFDLLCDKDGRVPVAKFWNAIKSVGLRHTDPRLKECRLRFEDVQRKAGQSGEGWDFTLDRDTFKECISENIFLIGKAFKNDLVIPEFYSFIKQIEIIYQKCKDNDKGKPADYIPQLARANPTYWGVSICTIDGQRHSFGNTNIPFCLQSCSKPLNYALAISDIGQERVHRFVGQEPSGRSFNELTLDASNKPHNPMINAGAIVISSLLEPKKHIADRFDYAFNQYKRLAGGEYIGFSNSTYLSERETADRNFALGYYMRENGCFPEHTDLIQTLELYFQLCSVEATTDSSSVIAATLANGGICPISGERILAGDAVRSTLSLMYSCGMYDYSGQFAFKVGLPAKSGVAGAILLVIPNMMGICVWGPPLDELGNSCRGVQFCEELVKVFNFHNYDDLNHTERKMDPRKSKVDTETNSVVNLLFGSSTGDVTAIRRFALSGMDMTASDYDGRTALHLAAAEGHLHVIRMLIEQCHVPPQPKDRWNFTPLDDARRFSRAECVVYLEEHIANLAPSTPESPCSLNDTSDPASPHLASPPSPHAIQHVTTSHSSPYGSHQAQTLPSDNDNKLDNVKNVVNGINGHSNGHAADFVEDVSNIAISCDRNGEPERNGDSKT